MVGNQRELSSPHPSAVRAGRKSPIRIRYLLVAGVMVWAGIHYLGQHEQLMTLESKQANLNHQLATLQSEHKKLETESQQLQDKDYITAYAAKHFGLVLPGQVSFDIRH